MKCSLPCCDKPRTKGCSVCLKGGYYSTECQKEDWPIHKLICSCLKNEGMTKLMPINNVKDIFHTIIAKLMIMVKGKVSERVVNRGSENERRLLQCAFFFAKYQFGNTIISKGNIERDNIVANKWHVDSFKLGTHYYNIAHTKREKDISMKGVYYYTDAQGILEFWRAQIELPVR